MIKEGEIPLLNKLVRGLEEAQLRLEESYEKKDYENFEKAKKAILQTQRKISEIVK